MQLGFAMLEVGSVREAYDTTTNTNNTNEHIIISSINYIVNWQEW